MERRRERRKEGHRAEGAKGIDDERFFSFDRPFSTSTPHQPEKLTLSFPPSLSPSFSLTPPPPRKHNAVIVKASSGPRYVVGCRPRLLAQGGGKGLAPGTRVTLDMTTLTIMRSLKREVDPVVHNMAAEDPGKVDYSSIGGLGEQVRLDVFFLRRKKSSLGAGERERNGAPRTSGPHHRARAPPFPPFLLPTNRKKPTDPRDPGVDRAPAPQPGALRARRHQAPQGRPALRPPGDGEDAARAGHRRQHGRQLPEGRGLGDRRQVHRGEREADPGDVRVRAGPPAVHHLHGRGKEKRGDVFFPL